MPMTKKGIRWLGFGILGVMFVPVLALLLAQDTFTADLDRLAKSRDVQGLTQKAVQGAWQGRNPFVPLRTNGAFDTGRFGWTALSGAAPWGKQLIVFSTALTSEDVGERLFETDGTKLTRYIDEREDQGWRIEKHKLEVAFDVPLKTVRILDSLVVRRIRGNENLILRMGPNYRVISILKPDGKDAQWTQLGGIIFVADASDGMELRMSYAGVVDKPGFAGSIRPSEALLTNDYWYPMIARKPTPFTIKVRTLPAWTVVTHGEQISNRVVSGVRETEFKMDLPISYWSLNAGAYKLVEQQIAGRTYKCWSMVLDDERMRLQPRLIPPIVQTFELFARFPFTGYGSCMTPTYGGGALEGYSFVTSGYFSGEDAHELAHTWFGGIVNNTYLTSFWNESFAVWGEGFYLRNSPIGNRQERREAYIQTPTIEPAAYNSAPLNNAPADIGPAATSLGYGKGAFVLQMLEQELGPETFVNACRTWLSTHDKTKGGEWEGFESAVAKVAPQNMTWFFDQWVRKPGFADFSIENVRYESGAVVGTVEFRGPWHRINCEVMIETNGRREFRKVALPTGELRIPVPRKPTLVSFDPWRRILRPIAPDEHPVSIESLASLPRIDLRRSEGWLRGVGRETTQRMPRDPAGHFIVGTPIEAPALEPVYARAGISVVGHFATYRGTRIDLNRGGFLAVVDLEGGKHCLIGAGRIQHPPQFGRARLMIMDELGRFLRGVSEPKTTGNLTFRL